MADMFLEKFRSLVPKYLEDQWNEADGLSAGELADGLAEAKVKIPFVLEEFYLALGNNDDFMEAYHYFFDPEELEIEDGYLLFLEDEEEKFVWGFKQSQLEVPEMRYLQHCCPPPRQTRLIECFRNQASSSSDGGQQLRVLGIALQHVLPQLPHALFVLFHR